MGEDPESNALRPRDGAMGEGDAKLVARAAGVGALANGALTPPLTPTPTIAVTSETSAAATGASGDCAVSLAAATATTPEATEAAGAEAAVGALKKATGASLVVPAEEAETDSAHGHGNATADASLGKGAEKTATHTNGTAMVTANGALEEQQQPNGTAASEPATGYDDAEEGDVESDGVAEMPAPGAAVDAHAEAAVVADAAPAPTKQSRSPTTAPVKDDEELTADTSVEDVHSPEVICLDSDDKDGMQEGDDEAEAAAVASEVSVEEERESVGRGSLRRNKRTRVLGFSHNQHRKRQGLSIVSDATADGATHQHHGMVPAPSTTRVRRQRSGDAAPDAAGRVGDAGAPHQPATTNTADLVSWDWELCRAYCDPLTQTTMDELVAVRRESARVVSANSHMWGSIRRLEHDDAYLVSMATDVSEDVDHLRVRPVRRGRSFRDAWEEEDIVATQQRPSRPGKKRPFAGCEAITSNRELVRGYDDELFTAFTKRLEARAAQARSSNSNGTTDQDASRIDESPTRRLKTAKRRIPTADNDTLPAVPVHHLHPASCGAWKLKGKDKPSYDTLHPAAIRATKTPQRWVEERERELGQPQEASSAGLRRSGRHENKPGGGGGEGTPDDDDEEKVGVNEAISDEAIELPSFGVVMEEDEISREITGSLVRLVELSALNWRRTQTLYERAVSYIEVTPLLQAEDAAKQRLEQLYKTLYPPCANPDDTEAEYKRELKFTRRPRDLLSFITSRSTNGPTESLAVCGSVEYALRLKGGESIDVLDRNGCWNDGVVIDVYSDAGGDVKNVLVSFALWAGDATEWVPVLEARILPRGVADGRVSFTLGPTRARKRCVELNKHTADLLQSTYPSRQMARFQLQQQLGGVEEHDLEAPRASSKKQRRR